MLYRSTISIDHWAWLSLCFSLTTRYTSEQRATDVLQEWGIDFHALRSAAMLHRSHFTKVMYDPFTGVLCKEGVKHHQQARGSTSRDGSKIVALSTPSTRVPPGEDLSSYAGGRGETVTASARLTAYGSGGRESEGTECIAYGDTLYEEVGHHRPCFTSHERRDTRRRSPTFGEAFKDGRRSKREGY